MKKIVFFVFVLMGLGTMNVVNGQDVQVTTHNAENITQTKATLCGSSNFFGNVPGGYFCYTKESDSWDNSMRTPGYLPAQYFTYQVTNLSPNTTYRYVALFYWEDGGGSGNVYWGTGNEITFTTLPIKSITLAATNITSSDATLNGMTDFDGEIDEQGFILTKPTGKDTIVASNNSANFTHNVTDLPRNTIFSYRTYSKTSYGTFFGEEVKFATLFKQDGTTNLIENLDDMLALSKLVEEGFSFAEKKLKLVNDIVLPTTPNNINAIGKYDDNNPSNRRPFRGEFDGNGKRIYNVYIDHPNSSYQGLFGYVKDGSIYNLGLVNITASGRDYTGGMIAYAENAKITDCYVSGGTLYALSYCGGLIGYQTPGTNSIITSCYNTCAVTGNNYVGGLLGYSDKGTVRNSYVAGAVSGISATTGAIIGGALNVLTYNCYFNEDITGQSVAIGENTISRDNNEEGDEGGMSSDEMRLQEFVTTLNKGLPIPVWKMDFSPPINNGFPILMWQTQFSDIEENEKETGFTLYPNPTSGKVRVESGELRVESVEVFDVFGKNVSRLTSHISHPISIDIFHLPSGVYFLRIMTGEGVVVRKVVKM